MTLGNKGVIFGCSGLSLNSRERIFFKEHRPLGLILFSRNIESPLQVRELIDDFRETLEGGDIPPLILVDQEGGRVARLGPPNWGKLPPSAVFWPLADRDLPKAKEAVYLHYLLIGKELADLGINMDCAPVLDLLIPGAHDIIGDRAFGEAPEVVSILGDAACEGLLDSGVLPVIKHIPGHGRAKVDSHENLPVVDTFVDILEKTDFRPFRHLSDMPFAMTAHITYTDIDQRAPATLSPRVISLIRSSIGFDGVLMTDDLSMKALSGSMALRVAKSIEAGCDIILHCNGDMSEMQEIAKYVPLCPAGVSNAVKGALKTVATPKHVDVDAARKKLYALLSNAGNL